MQVDQALNLYNSYLKDNTRPNTIRVFAHTLSRFHEFFKGRDLNNIKEGEIIEFILSICQDCSASTKNIRVSIIKAFYNFVIGVSNADFTNPCMKPLVRKIFKNRRKPAPNLVDKDIVDEIIFRTTNERDRLILELMGGTGMRIGEVLGMRLKDVDFDASTILVAEPKSGRRGEKVFVPKKLIGKLHTFILSQDLLPENRVFNLSYSTAHRMVRKAANLVNVKLRPHDLRRHAATQASRNNIPLEIVSKVILKHADISTTQRYLGAIDPNEASRWIEHLHR